MKGFIMSTVSSVGGSSLYQWLQQLNPQNQTGTTATTAVTGGQDSDGDTDGSTASSSGSVGQSTGSGKHHGHGHSHGISSQLQSAITSALGSSNGTTDPNQVIQNAITQFLAANQNGAGGTSATSASTASATSSSSASATDPASQQAAFAQLLSSNGVDPKQFQQDLQTALQSSSSSGGAIDFSKVFQNFPPGSSVNVLA